MKTIAHAPSHTGRSASVLLAVGIALLPKCPACCGAYVSVLSSLGVASLPHARWLVPGMLVLLLVNLIALGVGVRTSRAYGPLLMSVAGAVSLASAKLWLESPVLSWIGVGLILSGSVWNFAVKKRACPQRFR